MSQQTVLRGKHAWSHKLMMHITYLLAAFNQKSSKFCGICHNGPCWKVPCTTSSFSSLRNILDLIHWIGSICEISGDTRIHWEAEEKLRCSETSPEKKSVFKLLFRWQNPAATTRSPKQLQKLTWRASLCLSLTHHVHQRHIQEEPGCEGEYPHGDVVCVMSDQDPGHHA